MNYGPPGPIAIPRDGCCFVLKVILLFEDVMFRVFYLHFMSFESFFPFRLWVSYSIKSY